MRNNPPPSINEHCDPADTLNGVLCFLDLDSLLPSLDLATIDPYRLQSYLLGLVSDPPDAGYFESLIALYIASEVYRGLGEAEINLSIAERPIFDSRFGSTAAPHAKGCATSLKTSMG